MAEIKNCTINSSSGVTCAAQKLAFAGNFSSDITFAQQKLVSTEIYREPAMVRLTGME